MKQARGLSGFGQQANRLDIEGHEGLAAQPSALMGYDAIGEIAPGLKHRQAGLHSGTVGRHVA